MNKDQAAAGTAGTERTEARPAIREAVVVEGRDDAAVVDRAVRAVCITTHGFGISEETWELIGNAYRTTGIIILTDPDHAGETIRRRVSERFPEAKHAYVARDQAESAGDIGVENAAPKTVREALLRARATVRRDAEAGPEITGALLDELGLTGAPGSADLRAETAKALGIGYGNGRTFLRRANGFGITREKLISTVHGIQEKESKK